jgi:hypothetical protein
MSWLDGLKGRLSDQRSGKVAFVSHCLLNQNAHYLGGASCPGVKLRALSPLLESGVGIVQLPCPEIAAWGGPDKILMWLPLGPGGRAVRLLAPVLKPLFILWSRAAFLILARRAARGIGARVRSGQRVVAFVGIDGSPTCGVNATLDLGACFDYACGLDPAAIDAAGYNRGLYARCAKPGTGYFSRSLRRRLARMGISVPFMAHDLAGDLGVGSGPGPLGQGG